MHLNKRWSITKRIHSCNTCSSFQMKWDTKIPSACECNLIFHCNSVQVRQHEQRSGSWDASAGVDSSSRHSGTGQDSGFGSDSARIRIVQIEQQSGTSHHCIARPSHKSTIIKNLNFIPFDIFLTASRLSVMTYACSSPPKALSSSLDTPGVPEKKDLGEKVNKHLILNQ